MMLHNIPLSCIQYIPGQSERPVEAPVRTASDDDVTETPTVEAVVAATSTEAKQEEPAAAADEEPEIEHIVTKGELDETPNIIFFPFY